MNAEHLSRRLSVIAQEIPYQARMADIGTDHGYLPVYLVKHGKVEWALASDVNEAPLNSAVEKIKREGLGKYIQTRVGPGLAVIKKEDNIDTAVIAGMGGSLISSILEDGKNSLKNIKRLVLQPNVGAAQIRKWMIRNNWQIINEHIIEEDEHIYEILIAEPGDPYLPYQLLGISEEAGQLFGPYLIKKQPSAFIKKWKREKESWQYVLQEIEKASERGAVLPKKKELMKKLSLLEEVLKNETS
ncbi:tRNA (adenine(22)-N(1))-methyltransferase [Alteribacillus bidgolensis]|uniref:tRNA (Adenine22-N1)-methyltransferase n=1 Tax=Alteribacillus bidgolensis TaxID=930129 RepID=A0A1G8P320_9BACI|nr:tRNA (adenine(22)-N(1))-methyltransferase TrmK [Alteribacillus bidgolensis]SDI86210.1 tRNA (adenine22-N1)-methyltransferase [Alteribacillus bidgolensis]